MRPRNRRRKSATSASVDRRDDSGLEGEAAGSGARRHSSVYVSFRAQYGTAARGRQSRFPMAADSCRRRAELLPRKAAYERRRELTPTAKWQQGSHPPGACRFGRPPAPSTSGTPIRRSRISRPTRSTNASLGNHCRHSPARDAARARACPRPPGSATTSVRADRYGRKSTLAQPYRLLNTQPRALEMTVR